MRSLKEKDLDYQERTGRRRYWVVESPEEFARLARVNASIITQHPMATADFTSMYTCFNQVTMVTRIINALEEAQAFEASRHPEGEQPPSQPPPDGAGMMAGP